MKSIRMIKLNLTLVMVAMTLSNCTTLMSSQGDDQKIPETSMVVMRSGRSGSVMSTMDRKAWIRIHQNSKHESQKAQAALAAGEYQVAISEAQNLLRASPKNAAALNVLVLAHAMTNNYEKSSLYANLYERYHGANATTLNARAMAIVLRPRINSADLRQGIALFEQAFAMSNSEIAAGMNLGNLYLDMGDNHKAEDVFATVKGRCQSCYDSQLGYSIALTRNNKFGQAKKELIEILQNQPHDATARYHLALVEKNGYNNIEESKKHLRQLLAHSSKDSPMYRQAYVFLRRLETLDRSKIKRRSAPGPQGQGTVMTNTGNDEL